MNKPIAIVSGATGGMGVEIVKNLAVDHVVYAIGRNVEVLTELSLVPNVKSIASDIVSSVLEENRIAELNSLSQIDVLVHAAAVGKKNSVETADVASWREHFDINVVVPAELTRQLLPALRNAGGQVVFINSGAGSTAQPHNVVYAASKHALRGLADGFRKEEALNGVRVSTISPGPTDTEMLKGMVAAQGGSYQPELYIHPVEVAAAIRLVVDSGATTQITNVDVRPRVELADRN